jgi:predicted DNA-binding transcriptional regulator AlpA
VGEELDAIRVLSRSETIRTVGLSDRTWDRLEAAGDTPPKTRISAGRIGYRISDVKEWLDRRREAGATS